MPAPLAAAALVPVAAEAAKAARTRVIGWDKTVTRAQGKKVIVEHSSLSVEAWELGVIGLAGAAWWFVTQGKWSDGGSTSNPIENVIKPAIEGLPENLQSGATGAWNLAAIGSWLNPLNPIKLPLI